MWQFICQHEIITLIIVLSALWATERTIRSIVERNKPSPKCGCNCCGPDEDDDEDEIVAMGGETEEHEDEK